jgi:hypothetical protein
VQGKLERWKRKRRREERSLNFNIYDYRANRCRVKLELWMRKGRGEGLKSELAWKRNKGGD